MNEDLYYTNDLFTVAIENGKLVVNIHLNTDHDYSDLKVNLLESLKNNFLYNIFSDKTNQSIISFINKTVNTYIQENNVIIKNKTNIVQPINICFNKEFDEPVKTLDDKTFNERLYWPLLTEFKVENRHDTKMIANKLSSLYKKYPKRYSERICLSDENKTKTELYEYIYRHSRYESYDIHMYNEVTGNYYWVGFSYIEW